MGKLKQHQEAEDNPREFPDDPQIQRCVVFTSHVFLSVKEQISQIGLLFALVFQCRVLPLECNTFNFPISGPERQWRRKLRRRNLSLEYFRFVLTYFRLGHTHEKTTQIFSWFSPQ